MNYQFYKAPKDTQTRLKSRSTCAKQKMSDNSDSTSSRAREYLSMLRTKLGSDLATCERIQHYAEE